MIAPPSPLGDHRSAPLLDAPRRRRQDWGRHLDSPRHRPMPVPSSSLPSRAAATGTAFVALALATAASACGVADAATRQAHTPPPAAVDTIHPSVTLDPPQGRTRTIDFTTDEGTFMALDVARDGRWVAFDLLGQVYGMPTEGGEARLLTGDAGLALNFHPAISPDGRRIAFISDRQGQNNVWVMNADGTDPRPVLLDRETRFMHPAWAPDGRSLVAVRVFPTPGRGWHRQTSELWRLPLDGSPPARLLGDRLTHYDAPAFSPDGRHLYFHVAYSTGEGAGLLLAGHRLQRLELATGRVDEVRAGRAPVPDSAYFAALRRTGYAQDVPGDPPAALTPIPSPNGRLLAFALERPGEAMAYRGHRFTPRTSLVVRDLASGEERVVLDTAAKDLTLVNAQYSYGMFPRFGWTPDGRALLAWAGGKIRRVPVDGGAGDVVPFRARVRRVLSEMVRSRVTIDDSLHRVRFLQWPVASPDGQRIAFVAAGSLWAIARPGEAPRRIATRGVALTPSWSPDGTQLAFATWDDSSGGGLWVAAADGTAPRRLALPTAAWLHPVWSPDGRSLVASRGGAEAGAGPSGASAAVRAAWEAWGQRAGWSAWRVPLDGGAPTRLTTIAGPARVHHGADGRLRVQHQEHADDGRLLFAPFPGDRALGLRITVRSMDADGGNVVDEVSLPARDWPGSEPVISPTGRWVAFQAGRFVYVAPVPPTGRSATAGTGTPRVDSDPNVSVDGRVRVFDGGGYDFTWRDASTLQLASGDRYVTYDAATGRRTVVPIPLRIPRPVPRGTIVLRNAKVVTIDGDRVIERGDVLVRGARIACVGEAGTCDAAGADRVIDLTGKVIIPGLIDMHAHHTAEPSGVVVPRHRTAALDLAYGVTTILDPSTLSTSAFPLAEMTEAGVVLGPRTFSTAEIVIYPGTGFGDQTILRTQADADREVDRRVDWGAVSIKNYRQAARYQQQMLLRAARRRGVTVTSEGGPLYFDVGQVLDGQTGWEHLLANLPVYGDATRFFGMAGITYSPTSIVAGHVAGSKEWFRPRQRLGDDARYRRFAPPQTLRAATAPAADLSKEAFSFPIIAEGLADIVRAGGHGALGEHGEQPGIGTHWELWAYAEALRAMEALRVATLDGAHFIGLEHELGSIATGKIADLLILDADPLVDIRNSVRIASVMKEGRLFDAATLHEVWPTSRALERAAWESGARDPR